MASAKAYASTEVPVAKSQEELRVLLRKFGADQFSFGEGADWAGVEFVHGGQLVRLRCPTRPPTVEQVREQNRKTKGTVDDARDVLARRDSMRVWRVLVWSVKARLVAVDEGVETFEQAFLSHLVDPSTGATLWQMVREQIESGVMRLGGGGLRALGPGS